LIKKRIENTRIKEKDWCPWRRIPRSPWRRTKDPRPM